MFLSFRSIVFASILSCSLFPDHHNHRSIMNSQISAPHGNCTAIPTIDGEQKLAMIARKKFCTYCLSSNRRMVCVFLCGQDGKWHRRGRHECDVLIVSPLTLKHAVCNNRHKAIRFHGNLAEGLMQYQHKMQSKKIVSPSIHFYYPLPHTKVVNTT